MYKTVKNLNWWIKTKSINNYVTLKKQNIKIAKYYATDFSIYLFLVLLKQRKFLEEGNG